MAGTTYLGPSDVLIVDGTAYRVGDEVPLNDEQRQHMAKFGHRFEDFDPATDVSAATSAYEAREGNPFSTGGMNPAPEAMPRGDRGEIMEGVRFQKRSRHDRADRVEAYYAKRGKAAEKVDAAGGAPLGTTEQPAKSDK